MVKLISRTYVLLSPQSPLSKKKYLAEKKDVGLKLFGGVEFASIQRLVEFAKIPKLKEKQSVDELSVKKLSIPKTV
jgi:hypothetical protein